MNFQSSGFFLLVLLTLAWVLVFSGSATARKCGILAVSYYFYALFATWFALLLMAYTVFFYAMAICLKRFNGAPAYKYLFFGALLLPLSALGYLKYSAALIHAAISSFSFLSDGAVDLNIVAPVGVSFFTFQGIAYLVDVHRGKTQPTRSFLDIAVFFGFFPSLLSGPINRFDGLNAQIRTGGAVSADRLSEGLYLTFRGFAKKIFFADILAAQVVNPAFQSPENFSSGFLILAVYAYTMQVYMDLSGYTDIARGVAKMLGFDLAENFKMPYSAVTLSEFWQRWHMSMSGFFRDYLFHGLGGSRTGNVYANLLLTFVAIGVWHGAGINFVIYGLAHGSVVGIERYLRGRRTERGLEPLSPRGFERLTRWFMIFNFVAFSRILFRAPDLSAALAFVAAIFKTNSPWPQGLTPVLSILAVSLALHFVPASVHEAMVSRIRRGPAIWVSGVLLLACLALMAGAQGSAGFIYFKF